MIRQDARRGPTAILAASLLALLAGGVRADEQNAVPSQASPNSRAETPRDRQPPRDVGHTPELRDETFRLMDAYLISNLQESVGLTDEQFARALPLVKKLQADRRDLARRRMVALRVLRKTLVSGNATEASVAELLKEVKNASADERAGTVRNADALDAVLTPLQQAKFRVFEAEVDVRLRHLLARSQDEKPPVR
jgi:Spy/CpxP family protein refolding chaperone